MKKIINTAVVSLLIISMSFALLMQFEMSAEASSNIKLEKSSVSILIGETTNINVKNASGAKIKYKSSKPKVATVSKKGKVIGKAAGSTIINVKVKKNKRNKNLIFKVKVKRPTILGNYIYLTVGKKAKLSINNKPKNGNIVWKTTNKSVVIVDRNGTVTAKAEGKANVIATIKVNGKIYKSFYKITVKNKTDSPSATKTYIISYNTNGGTEIEKQIVKGGELAKKPVDPVKTGYIFGGWYVDENLKNAYDFSSLVNDNILLYAKWNEIIDKSTGTSTSNTNYIPMIQIKEYTLSFDSDGGSAVSSQKIKDGEFAIEPLEPEKEGYTFLGWKNSDNDYFEFDEAIENDMMLKAIWKKSQGSFENGITSVDVDYSLNENGEVSVNAIESDPLINTAGIIGAPVEITAGGGKVERAIITFHYKPDELSGITPEKLSIGWYDETNHIIKILENSVVNEGNHTVSVEINHFSKYCLIDKTKWDKIWNKPLPSIRLDNKPYYNVILALDCSGSMNSDTKIKKSIVAANGLVDSLTEGDEITVLAFASSTNAIIESTTIGEQRQNIKDLIGGLSANGGTNINNVLQSATNYNSENSQYQSLVFLLSDGQSSVSDTVIEKLKSNGQKVIAVGIGNDVDQNLMKKIASGTNGKFIYCNNANDLVKAFAELKNSYIGSTIDTDGDGLSDEAEIQGMRDQYGEIWYTDSENPDTDGDGLSDKDEMGEYNAASSLPYFDRVSRPDMYTVHSEKACLEMPDKMMYSFDAGNNRIELVVYTTENYYRVVPDLLSPPEEDGVPKEYIYSPAKNLKVDLVDIPSSFKIESLNTEKESIEGVSTAVTYRTSAILSYENAEDLSEVVWHVTADNCSEWTGYYNERLKVPYINKKQVLKANERKQETNSNVINYNVDKKKINYDEKADSANLEMARKAKALAAMLNQKSNYQSHDNSEALDKLKSQIDLYSSSTSKVPDEIYEAFAKSIYEAIGDSNIEKYENNSQKLAEQIYGQIKGGIKGDYREQKIGNTTYRLNYFIATSGFGGKSAGVAWEYINWGSNQVILTWKANTDEIYQALANYCIILEQLNNDVWKDFLAYYVSDACGLVGIKSVNKSNVSKVFDYSEKIIKAMNNKNNANALIEEIGGDMKNKLKSSLKNEFKKYIKENIPGGKKIVEAANQYVKAKNKYEKFKASIDAQSDEEKIQKLYVQFLDSYSELESIFDEI